MMLRGGSSPRYVPAPLGERSRFSIAGSMATPAACGARREASQVASTCVDRNEDEEDRQGRSHGADFDGATVP